MKTITFFCNWGESSKSLLERYKRQTPNNSGEWGNIKGISDYKKSDFYIVLDGINRSIVESKDFKHEKIIFIKREPKHIDNGNVNFDLKNVFASFNYPPYKTGFLAATWWIEKSYNDLIKNQPKKTKLLSAILTNKYKVRTSYITNLAEKIDLDVYGKWSFGNNNSFVVNKNYFGEIKSRCKSKGLDDYKFSIAIENKKVNNYWTEKIADCFLCNTMPIYYGADNIENYFPKESFFEIKTLENKEVNKEFIKNIIHKEITKIQKEAIEHSKHLVLNKYNIWNVISNIINE